MSGKIHHQPFRSTYEGEIMNTVTIKATKAPAAADIMSGP
jgi:hypothetical protein